MLVVACHPEDVAALWVHGALRSLGTAIDLVSVEQLVFSRSIVHWLDSSGDRGAIHLADGRTLRVEAITGLVNRIHSLPTQHFAAAGAADRAYATEELGAFVLAWLDAVAGRVINPPRPYALGGGALEPITIAHLAAMAALPTSAYRATSEENDQGAMLPPPPTHTTIVFDGSCFGPTLPQAIQEGCARLAALAGVPLLQVFLRQHGESDWQFVGASGTADFRIGGMPLAAAMVRALTAKAAS